MSATRFETETNRKLLTMNTTTTDNMNAPATVPAVSTEIKDGVDTNAFRPYDSQLPIPELSGFRTVKCLYKVAKTGKNAGKAAGENSYIRIADAITEIAVTERIAELAPYLVGYLQEQENLLVKSLHRAGMSILSPKQYGLDMVIAMLEEAGTASRMNKEMIETWFDAELKDNLLVAFAEKMELGEDITDADIEKLETIVAVYRAKLGSLASPKVFYRAEEVEMLQKALGFVAGDSSMSVRLVARLEKMKESGTTESLISLL